MGIPAEAIREGLDAIAAREPADLEIGARARPSGAARPVRAAGDRRVDAAACGGTGGDLFGSGGATSGSGTTWSAGTSTRSA